VARSYQISQYDQPLAEDGVLEVALPAEEGGGVCRVGVTRAHLEEDSGKLVHVGADGLAGSSHSLADYNRAGTPLVEIVSEPDLRSGREAAAYGAELQRLVRCVRREAAPGSAASQRTRPRCAGALS
jgi:aspartyl-tRNA(Asn)/glutamyl-tRNA(Gln) amidotransferase subunit B